MSMLGAIIGFMALGVLIVIVGLCIYWAVTWKGDGPYAR